MEFEELLRLLQDPGDTEVPVTIYDDLRGIQQTTLESHGAELVSKDEMIKDLTAEISRLKAVNYDKIMNPVTEKPTEFEGDNQPEDEEDFSGVDDLFGEEK